MEGLGIIFKAMAQAQTEVAKKGNKSYEEGLRKMWLVMRRECAGSLICDKEDKIYCLCNDTDGESEKECDYETCPVLNKQTVKNFL